MVIFKDRVRNGNSSTAGCVEDLRAAVDEGGISNLDEFRAFYELANRFIDASSHLRIGTSTKPPRTVPERHGGAYGSIPIQFRPGSGGGVEGPYAAGGRRGSAGEVSPLASGP